MKIGKNCLRFLLLLPVITLSLSYYDIYSQTGNQINFNSPPNILKFADYLFCDKDYLRAIDEYKRYLSFEDNDTAIFKLALSYSRIGIKDTAIYFYQKLIPLRRFSDEAMLEIAKICFRDSNFSILNKITNDPLYEKSRYYSSIRILNQLSILYGSNFEQKVIPQELFSAIPGFNREELVRFYERKINPPYKSPLFAAALSTIIPGAGKIYTGYYGDGISAFVLNGVLGYTAYSNFKAKHNFRGWLFAGLAGVFYLGNIYGSAVSAQIHNAGVDLNFKLDLDNFLTKQNYFIPNDKYFCK